MDSTSPPCVRFYRFGPCTLDLLKGRLWRDGTLIPLTRRSLEVLVALIEDRGRLVQKDDLLERVWPNTVVEENNLARHVCMLRKALHERPDEHEYIVTVPGQGYRFVAEVEELTELTDGPSNGAGPSPPRERGAHPPSASSPATLPEQVGSPGSLLERWPGRTVLAVTLVAVSVIATLVALDRSTSRVVSPPRPLWQLTYDPGLQHEPTWSPDGYRVAFTSDRAGNSDIWVQALADPTPIRVTSSTAHDWQPDWSPNGRWLAFRSERDGGGLYVISLRGGRERRVAAFGYRPRWSPDGSRILFSSSGLHLNVPPRMYVVGLDGQAPRPVRSDLLAEFRSVSVGWHPDGEHVSIWGRHRQTRWTFLTAPVAGGPASRWTLSRDVERQLDAAATTLTRFVWSSSAQYLYFEGLSENVHNIWRVTVDPHTMAWIAGPERLTTGVGDDSGIALSPDGTKLAFSIQSANTRLWAFPFDAASGKLTAPGVPVTSGATDVLNFDAPADSTRFVYRTIRAGQHELWERSIDDGRERLLIGDHEWARVGPTWSADGRRLAYQRERRSSEGRWVEQAVAVLPASGGAEYLLTTPGRLSMVPTDWSRDGSLILGACWTAEQRSGACVLPVARAPHAERHVRLVTSRPRWDLYEQRFSPNQRWISFNAVDATDASVSAIHVVPASGGRWTAITDGRSFDDVPRWAPDGRTVYFVSNRSGFLNVWGRRFDPEGGRPIGPPFQVTSFDGPREMLLPRMGNIKLVVSSNRLLVPVVETAGRIWILDNVDR